MHKPPPAFFVASARNSDQVGRLVRLWRAELCEVPLEAGGACPVFITGNPAPAVRDFTLFGFAKRVYWANTGRAQKALLFFGIAFMISGFIGIKKIK